MEGMINDYDVFFRGIYCKSVLYPLNKGHKVVAAVVLTVVNIVFKIIVKIVLMIVVKIGTDLFSSL